MSKRPVDIVVVSDVHLGTAACRAAELNAYLKGVSPRRLILCGDIIDMWHFRKGYWDEHHLKVLRRILKMAANGVAVDYIAGNHDDELRRYLPISLGGLQVHDRLELDLAGRRTLFLHGDAADLLVGTPRWLSGLGTTCYDGLEVISNLINRVRRLFGGGRASLATAIKERLPMAARHIARFEEVVARMAAAQGCEAVVCGHIHVPRLRRISVAGRDIDYLNSGDWVESCSALEWDGQAWELRRFHEAVEPALDETVAVPTGAAA